MILVDSHCHLNFPELETRLPEVLAAMRTAAVAYALVVSVSRDSFFTLKRLIASYPCLFGSVGVHPEGEDAPEFTVEEMTDYCRDPKIIAVGETGLDRYRSSGDLPWQRQRFIRHITAARRADVPLIIHTRAAGEETLDILEGEGADKVVIHCFTENEHFARRALELGYYLSFSGIVTFKNAPEIQEVCRQTPAERILIETDSPYLAPVPKRGKTNEPAFVAHTAAFAAALRGQSTEELARQTTANFFRLFTKARPAAADHAAG